MENIKSVFKKVGDVQTLPAAPAPTSRRRERLIAVSLACVNFAMGINFGILGPFFPLEGKQKKISPTLVGFIFGEFEFICFAVSPIVGYFLPRLGAKFTYISGCFATGVCSILFGFLAFCPPGSTFAVTAIVTRGCMAVASAMLVTASFAIIALTFPSNVAGMFGILETFLGIGLMMGPPIGGALYMVGGFVAPFATMGSVMLLAVPVTICFVDLGPDTEIPRSGSYLQLLRSPHVWIAGVMIWASSTIIGFMDPTLQPFLYDAFKLNEFLVGLVFICGPALYAIISPLVGFICDRKNVTKELMTVGCLICGVSFLFLGPSPFLNIGPPKLWLTITMSFSFGIGVGLMVVPATNDIIRESQLIGMEEGFSTFSVCSGYFNSAMSLGYFSGPMLGGILTQHNSFLMSSSYIAFAATGLGVFMVLYTLIFNYALGGRRRQPAGQETSTPDESTALLQ